MDITPQTDPTLFREIKVGAHSYDVFNDAYCGVLEELESAYAQAYKAANPDVVGKPHNETHFAAWKKSTHGSYACDRVAAKVLFFPKNGAPVLEGAAYDRLKRSDLWKALTFFAEERQQAELALSESTQSS